MVSLKGEEWMNLLSKPSADQGKAQRDFRKHAFLKAPILETKQMTIKGKAYRLIGQQVVASPFFSLFKVVDEHGERANEQVERKVFGLLSMLQIANHVKQITPWLHEQKMETPLPNDWEESVSETIQTLVKNSEEVMHLLHALEQQATTIVAQPNWTEPCFKALRPAWNNFWEKYNERTKRLIQFYTHASEHQRLQTITGPSLEALYKEAHFTWHLFKETVPVHTPIVTDIDDFIALQGEIGKVHETVPVNTLIQKSERFSFHFFKGMFVGLLVMLLTVTLLTFAGVFNLPSVITVGVLTGIAFYIRRINDRELLKLIEKRLMTHRREQLPSLPLIRKKYKRVFAAYSQRDKQQKKHAKPYPFQASIVKIPAWFLFFGIALMMISVAFVAVATIQEMTIGYFIVGAIFASVGLLLPKLGIGQKKITLEPGTLTIQKRIYQVEELLKIRTNGSKKHFYMYVTSNPDPLKFHLEKEVRNEVHAHVHAWCEQNFVRYEVK